MSKKNNNTKNVHTKESSSTTSQENSSDEERLEFEGTVIKKLPNNLYRVKVNEHIVLAYVAGKMKMHSIKIVEGDKVRVEVSPYDLHRGRIVFRSK